ncbi:MAG: efflux RND transporter periplasmic adaptor subunit [Parachlamydiales bacterium]
MTHQLFRKITFIALSCYSALAAHGGHHHDHDHDHDHEHDHLIALTEDQIDGAKITTEKTRPGYLIQQVRAPAKVIVPPQSVVHLVPKVSGVVAKIYKQIGDSVKANETIALIESREMAEAKANYLASLRRYEIKKTMFSKEKQLQEKKLTTDFDLLEAEIAAEESKIDVELGLHRLLSFGLTQGAIDQLPQEKGEDLRYYELKAPMKGTIVNIEIAPGEFISSEKDVLTLADLNERWLEIDVPPSHQNAVKKGLPTSAKASHGDTCETKLLCYKPVVEENTRTLKAYALLDTANHPWTPGTYVTVVIDSETTRFPIVVPKTAIQKIDGHDVVFVANHEGFEIRPVHVGPQDNVRIAVIEGLRKGEEIAISNTFLLKAEHEKDEAEHEH